MGIYHSNHIQGKKGCQFSQQIRGLNLEQVLLVAIDAAKLHQKAMICNYFGDVIARPFFFSVNLTGLTELISMIVISRRIHLYIYIQWAIFKK